MLGCGYFRKYLGTGFTYSDMNAGKMEAQRIRKRHSKAKSGCYAYKYVASVLVL